MRPKTSIFSPPYHIQSTASDVQSGFPYFSHHDAVSVLWSQKWRPLCQEGVYPFEGAVVEDFDPIFAHVISMSGDDIAVLYSPDDYAKPFMPVGEALVMSAKEAEQKGDVLNARDLYIRAAAVFRIARFPINCSEVTQEAWKLGKEAYSLAGKYLEPPSCSIKIPFSHADTSAGDADAVIEAYLRMPTGSKPKDGWPVLLFICGLDAYKTDQTPRTQIHVDRGFATVSFEIPGTGDCPAAPNDPASPDRLMSSVLDWVAENRSSYSFDTTKIVVRGISTGGYYAMRVAHTHANRLFAVVAQGGGCHHMFDAEWINAQNQMEYPFALADALAWKFGYRGANPVMAYAAGAQKFSLLLSGVLDLPSCKLLVLNGMEDSIFPIEDSLIVGTRGTKKDLLTRGDRPHMGNPGAEDILYDWIDGAVSGRP